MYQKFYPCNECVFMASCQLFNSYRSPLDIYSQYENSFNDYFGEGNFHSYSKSIEPSEDVFHESNERHRKKFTIEEARAIGDKLGIGWNKYNIEQFRAGLDVELEQGTINPATNVTNDDAIMTAKIALAHLNELPDYYTRLAKIEAQD